MAKRRIIAHFMHESEEAEARQAMPGAEANGARWLTGVDAVADHPHAPNYHQGFGAVSMLTTLPSPSAPTLRLEFLDPWQDPQQHFVRNGQPVRRRLTVSGGAFLRICLAWTDGAARDNPAPGDYLIQISASNLLQARQDYALVVVGELGSGLVAAV